MAKTRKKKIGIFLGRLQPRHRGHEMLIERIFKENDEALLCIGSAQKINRSDPLFESNPLSLDKRMRGLKKFLGENKFQKPHRVITVKDIDSDKAWPQYLKNECGLNDKNENVIYFGDKITGSYKNNLEKVGFKVKFIKRNKFIYNFSKMSYEISSSTEIRKLRKQAMPEKIQDLRSGQRKIYEDFKKKNEPKINKEYARIIDFIKNKHRNSKRRKAIIGISGGIDSALTLTLLAKALGSKNVIAVFMPYKGITSKQSEKSAKTILDFLNFPQENFISVQINKPVDETFKLLEKTSLKKLFTCADRGNIMARTRMQILYGLARAHKGLVAGTSNKTEISLGYYTLYGDSASDYKPIAELSKTEVWQMSELLKIPKEIIEQSPSAELVLEQTDEKELGLSYPLIDLMLDLLGKNIPQQELREKYGFSNKNIFFIKKRIEIAKSKSGSTPNTPTEH